MGKRKSLEERFWSKVNKTDTCWLWLGGRSRPEGHGTFYFNGKTRLAHRVSWFLAFGFFPKDCLLHKCDIPNCVRPTHLFEGSPKDNVQDALQKGRMGQALWTHCVRGYPLSGDNLYTRPNGGRNCRTCKRDYNREWMRECYAKRKK